MAGLPGDENHPNLSVVVPAYGKPLALRGCLRALAAQQYPGERFEVIVLDDGSPEPLEPHAREAANEWGLLHLRVIRQENGGVCAARNHGVAAASGEWCLFTDHDCEPVSGWLAAMGAAATEMPERLIGGPTVAGVPENAYCVAHELLAEYVMREFRERLGAPFFTGNNLAVRRDLYRRVGGFNERLHWAHEDREFADRWKRHGLDLGYADDAVVRHVHHFNLRSFCGHQFRYGTTSREYAAVRTEQDETAARFPGFGYYWKMLGYPFARDGFRWQAFQMSGLLAMAQMSYVCGVGWSLLQPDPCRPRY